MGVNIGLVMSCAGIFYKSVSASLSVSVGSFGLYMTFVYATSFLMLSVAGKMIDKYSARWILTASSGILGLVYLGMSQFSELWEFYIAGAIIGVSLSFLLYLSYPILISRWFGKKVGFYIGICSAASGVGGILFNPLAGTLISEYGWRNSYMIFGLVILAVVTPLLALLLRSYPKDIGLKPLGIEKENSNQEKSGIPYSAAIKSPVFYALIVFAFLMISVSTLNLFLPTYINDIGYTVEEASLVASAVMLGVTIGKVALGWLNDKSAAAGILASTGLGMTGLFLLTFSDYGIVITTLGGFLFGWAYAGVTVETALLVRTIFGTKDYAKIFSNISIALALGGAAMAGGWGYISDFIKFKFILMIGITCLMVSMAIGFYSLTKKKNIL